MRCTSTQKSIGYFLTERNVINESPTYQRESGVWGLEKQQLFLDSMFNGYDVPKIYLHDTKGADARFDYAVIDGKQRLATIWAFMDGGLSLANDFDLFEPRRDHSAPQKGSKFRDLDDYWQEFFKSRSLDVVLVQDADEEDIEDLFSRLNNGEPLNAAEKRNAMGGDMCSLIRDVSEHKFFTQRAAFPNKRYQHYEVAAKVLLIESTEAAGGSPFVDLKKRFLDKMVRDRKVMETKTRLQLQERVTTQLDSVARLFGKHDPMLAKQAYPPAYYLFAKTMEKEYAHRQLFTWMKAFIPDFNARRHENLELPEDQRDSVIIEFSRLMQQGTNDKNSLEMRVSILRRYFLQEHPDIELRDRKRGFSQEERAAIYFLSGKRCAKCRKNFTEIEEMHADHEKRWAEGGKTSLKNGRALCETCNLSS